MSEEHLQYLVKEGTGEQLSAYLENVKSSMAATTDDLDSTINFLLNRRDDKKYTLLHSAIFARKLDIVQVLLEVGRVDVNLKCHGTPPLHLAISVAALPDGYEFGIACFELLLNNINLNIVAKDDQLQTIMHLICDYDMNTQLEAVYNKAKESNNNEIIDMKDRSKCTPLHRCALRDSINCAKYLLLQDCELNIKDSLGNLALHLAISSMSSKSMIDMLTKKFKEAGLEKETNAFGRVPSEEKYSKTINATPSATRTAILTHDLCRKHYTCPPSETNTTSAPPENLKRLSVLLDDKEGCLRSSDLDKHLCWVDNCRPAAVSDVLRVHEWPWIRLLQAKCESLSDDPEAPEGAGNLDGDTTISRHTFDAALHAAGSVIQAVDLVMAQYTDDSHALNQEASTINAKQDQAPIRNAFCAVRPPGHHAGPRGLVAGLENGPNSHGFCLLNNVSIGAAYAMNVHRDKIKRVCIVDFDVHHGNGTEETVKWLKPGVEHESITTPWTFGTMALPRYKPWYDFNDHDNVLFVSVHGFGPRDRGLPDIPQAAFYPGTGATVVPDLPPASPLRPDVTTPLNIASTSTHITATRTEEERVTGVLDKGEEGDPPLLNPDVISMEFDSNDILGNVNQGEDADEGEREDGSGDLEEESFEETDDGVNAGLDINNKKLMELKDIFYNNSHVKTNEGNAASMPPLIMDIGVRLAPEDDPVGNYRHTWRNYFRDEIFPRIQAFEPDMIFISAGFDAHKKDEINSGYISLVEEDYDWATSHLQRIANSVCDGRLVSVLEGGYQINGEHMSAFAKSVKAHVVALTRGARVAGKGYDKFDLEVECNVEKDTIAAMEARRRAKLEEARRREELLMEQMRQAAMAAQTQADLEMNTGDTPSNPDSITATTTTITTTATTTNDEPTNKRRRSSAPVDYVALNEELNQKKSD